MSPSELGKIDNSIFYMLHQEKELHIEAWRRGDLSFLPDEMTTLSNLKSSCL